MITPGRHRVAYSSRMSFSLNVMGGLNRLYPKDIRNVLRSSDLPVWDELKSIDVLGAGCYSFFGSLFSGNANVNSYDLVYRIAKLESLTPPRELFFYLAITSIFGYIHMF